LESIWKQTGVKPSELDNIPELPSVYIYCYEIFSDLSRRRTNSGFGMNPLSFAEILAYKELLQIDLEIWEVKIILLLDEWLLDFVAKQEEKKNKK